MLRSNSKQSEESMESVLKKKRKATVGRICRKEGFKPKMNEWGGRGWSNTINKGKSSLYSITERRVPELIPVLGSQPAGDASHEPGGRMPLRFEHGPSAPESSTLTTRLPSHPITSTDISCNTRNRRQVGRRKPPPEHIRTHRRTDKSKT